MSAELDDSSRSKPAMTLHRRSKIAELVRQQGAARVGELADEFQVSEVTIRNDLDQLEKDGRLVRDRGGAIAGTSTAITSLARVDQRANLNQDEKRRIGRAAAKLVNPGDTIILDAGTTTLELARAAAGISPLTVVTNSLEVACELTMKSEAGVILLGGNINRQAGSTLGAHTEHHLGEFVAQKLFLGTQAFDLEHGLTDTTIDIAQVKRAMVRAARRVILLTDSSKWQRSGFMKVVPLKEIDTIITDTNLPAEAREAIEGLGVELILV
jgi:DeoR/GlpR family transcriptional regulator of sugar metabolism